MKEEHGRSLRGCFGKTVDRLCCWTTHIKVKMLKEYEYLAAMHHIMVTVHVHGPDRQALHFSSTSCVPLPTGPAKVGDLKFLFLDDKG